ncbi:MAG: FG-GAP-like repeat-containing protein [Planctomycetota bacterium]
MLAAAGLVAMPAAAQCDTVSFGNPTGFALPNGTVSIDVGDVDGDGNVDLLSADSSSPIKIFVSYGDGLGEFGAPIEVTSSALLGRTGKVQLADVNGDGALDITGYTSQDVREFFTLINNAAGGFSFGTRVALTREGLFFAATDIDNDGDYDCVIATRRDSGFVVLENDGVGSFTVFAEFDGVEPRDGLLVADLNGDLLADIVGAGGNEANIYFQLVGGGFSAPSRLFFPLTTIIRDSVTLDADVDGDTDVVWSLTSSASDIRVARNDGLGNFVLEATSAVGQTTFTTLAAADINADGFDDFAAGSSDDSFDVYLNEQSGGFQFVQSVPSIPQDLSRELFAIDVDSDGDVDFVERRGNTAVVVLNQCNSAPLIDQQPTQAIADEGDAVVLSVGATLGTRPLAYQWLKNGEPMVDGGSVTGATSPTLTISPATPNDSDIYETIVSNAFGSDVSEPAVVAVRETCVADLNGDGAIDFFDVSAFLDEVEIGCD